MKVWEANGQRRCGDGTINRDVDRQIGTDTMKRRNVTDVKKLILRDSMMNMKRGRARNENWNWSMNVHRGSGSHYIRRERMNKDKK